MSISEETKPEEAPIPTWEKKPNTFFGRLKETILLLARLEKDDTAKYYGDLADDCLKMYKPSLFELLKKAQKIDKLHPEERENLEHYDTEEERSVVSCLNKLQLEKKTHFVENFEDRDACYKKCEAEHPVSTGTLNFYWRHSCKRDCETQFSKDVKPKLRVLREHRDEVAKQEQEKLTE